MQSDRFIKVVWRTNSIIAKISGVIILFLGLRMFVIDLSGDKIGVIIFYYSIAVFCVFIGMSILFNELGAEIDLEKKKIREYFHLIFYKFYTPWRNLNDYKYILVKELQKENYKIFLKISSQKGGKEILATDSLDQAEAFAMHISGKMNIEIRKLLLK